MYRRDGDVRKFALVDVATGASRHEFIPDSVWWDWTPLPDGGWAWIPDGTGLFHAYETAETVTLIRLEGSGASCRLGTIPRPISRLSVSEDLKRVVLSTRDYFGDVWLRRVVPAGTR